MTSFVVNMHYICTYSLCSLIPMPECIQSEWPGNEANIPTPYMVNSYLDKKNVENGFEPEDILYIYKIKFCTKFAHASNEPVYKRRYGSRGMKLVMFSCFNLSMTDVITLFM